MGDGTVSAIALVIFVALVAYVARSRRDVRSPEEATADAHEYTVPEREAARAARVGFTPAAELDS